MEPLRVDPREAGLPDRQPVDLVEVLPLVVLLADSPLGDTEALLAEPQERLGRGAHLGDGRQPRAEDLQETLGGAGVSPSQVTVHGLRFCEEVLVHIDDYVLDSSDINRIDDNIIEILDLPAPDDIGSAECFFDTDSCTTDSGTEGIRNIPTQVDITVECVLGSCVSEPLTDLTYDPEDTTCREVEPRNLP